MKYIAAKFTSETYTEIQACNNNYDSWYQRLRTTTTADVAKELNSITDHFALCLGLVWGPDKIEIEYGLEESVIVEISETIGEMSQKLGLG